MPHTYVPSRVPSRLWRLLAAAGAFALAGLPVRQASAQTTLSLGDWALFTYLLEGNSTAVTPSFVLNVSGRTRLRAVDLGFTGDRFALFANGERLFTTGAVPNPGTFTDYLTEADGNAAYASGELSRGETFLSAGRYVITLTVTDAGSGFEDGAGLLRADAAPIEPPPPTTIPEPTTALLAGVGLVALVTARRRRTARPS